MNLRLNNLVTELIYRMQRNIAYKKRTDGRFLLVIEKRLVKRLDKVFKKQMKFVLDEVGKLSFFGENYLKNDAVDDTKEEIEDFVLAIPGQKEVTEEVISSMKSSMLKGGKSSVKYLKLFKFGISFDLRNEKAIEILTDRRKLELSNYKGNIHDTTKERILKILLDAAKSGQSYRTTAKLISAQGEKGVFSRNRGQLIATREIGRAYGEGNYIPVQEFSEQFPKRKTEKFWQTVEDDDVTEECEKNQSKGWVPLDHVYETKGSDEFAPRKSNPRCRCFQKYQIT